MEIVLYILIFQGLLGAYDVFVNHEWREHLPYRASASLEQLIHGIRELFYAVIFLGLAWFCWQGIWAWLLFGMLVVEVLLTAWDFVVEDQTRVLSPNERITHLTLSMGGGAYVALLIPELWHWSLLPSVMQATDYGWVSWVLTALGIGVLVWGVRDLNSGIRLMRPTQMAQA